MTSCICFFSPNTNSGSRRNPSHNKADQTLCRSPLMEALIGALCGSTWRDAREVTVTLSPPSTCACCRRVVSGHKDDHRIVPGTSEGHVTCPPNAPIIDHRRAGLWWRVMGGDVLAFTARRRWGLCTNFTIPILMEE